MKRLLILTLIAVLGGCGDDGRVFDPDAATALGDSDGDGIPNELEGSESNVDTDGDGEPDYLDLDSDNDGISDMTEAPDGEMPADSDDDGFPDFQDFDSDNNGILDEDELRTDTDGDGTEDYADLDDDGDNIPDFEELMGRVDFPADNDDDGIPNFKDVDSDNDTISDTFEFGTDTDGDGLDDSIDEDSDGDGLSDAEEAGDDDLETRPVDTDEDGAFDFRDLDSDNDGLSDALEAEGETDRLDPDTDDDGVSDLIEAGAGTDPLDPEDNPRANGDFVFVVPFAEAPEPERDTLEFRSNIQFADLYFLFDTTGSMSTEISALKSASVTVLENLTCMDFGTPCVGDPECESGQVCSADGSCVADPRETGCIASLWSGVGTYAGNQNSYRNLLALQSDPTETQRRIPGSASGGGAAESLFESVACVADPSACTNAECVSGGIGCPAFRADSIRILATITDEDNECTTCPLNMASGAATRLRAEEIIFIGVDADGTDPSAPEADLKAIAEQSMSLDSFGDPLYVRGSESMVTDAVTRAVREIAQNRPIFVNVGAEDLPGDDGDSIPFIDRIEVNLADTEDCTGTASVADTDGDGFDDAFPSLRPGTPICWDVVARENTFVMPTGRPQVFQAEVVVRGDGSILDTRRIFFLVPPDVGRPLE